MFGGLSVKLLGSIPGLTPVLPMALFLTHEFTGIYKWCQGCLPSPLSGVDVMAYFPENVIDRVRDSVNIVDVVSRYVSLKKSGRNYMGLCPFHKEKTPSFSVHPEKQIFHCFGCGVGGNVFKFLMEYERISFPEAVRQLAREAGIDLPEVQEKKQERSEADRLYEANQVAALFYHRMLREAPAEVQTYLRKRGLKKQTLEFFQIGYAPDEWDGLLKYIRHFGYSEEVYQKAGLLLRSERTGNLYDRFRHRLMFPIHNPSGRVVAFGGRTLREEPDAPKYINSPETAVYQKSRVLYGLHAAREAIRSSGRILVVEGYMDVLQLHQAGIKNVVATSGTALTEQHAQLMRRYASRVVLCYDSDTAGVKAAIRGGEVLFLNNLDVSVLLLPAGEDPDSYVRQHGADAFMNLLDEAREYLDFRLAYYRQHFQLDRAADRSAVVGELVEMLAQLRDPIKTEVYLEQIGHGLKLSESLVRNQLKSRQRAARRRLRRDRPRAQELNQSPGQQPPVPERVILQGAWGAERDLLVLLINHYAQLKEVIRSYVQEEHFLNPEFREAYRLILSESLPRDDAHTLLHHLLEKLDSPVVARLLTERLFEEIRNPEKYLQDCIQQMRIAWHRSEIERRKMRLRRAEAEAGEPDTTLLKEIQAHMQALRRWQQGFQAPMEGEEER
ncbi:MAG: DNA primase [Calditrichaeota bacterium]|nr:MAG: DNA primase [Calditrichota bacterium]